jgi:hypothetical protein
VLVTGFALGCGVGSGAFRASDGGSRAAVVLIELQGEDPSPGSQVVWVQNRTGRSLALGCWSLSSEALHRKLFVQRRLVVPARSVAILVPAVNWLAVKDRVTLRDRAGRVVDRTPKLRDAAFDDRVWFRRAGRWRFGRTQAATRRVGGNLVASRPSGC